MTSSVFGIWWGAQMIVLKQTGKFVKIREKEMQVFFYKKRASSSLQKPQKSREKCKNRSFNSFSWPWLFGGSFFGSRGGDMFSDAIGKGHPPTPSPLAHVWLEHRWARGGGRGGIPIGWSPKTQSPSLPKAIFDPLPPIGRREKIQSYPLPEAS